MKLDLYLSPCTKLSFKWIKDFNIRHDVLTPIEEKVSRSLELIGIGKDFLNRTLMAQMLTGTINKCDLMKPKGFYIGKNTIIPMMKQPKE